MGEGNKTHVVPRSHRDVPQVPIDASLPGEYLIALLDERSLRRLANSVRRGEARRGDFVQVPHG